MKAMAITDHGNMFGAVAFHDACRDAGHQAHPGLRDLRGPGQPLRRRPASGIQEAYNHLTLLAANDAGYHNLVKLVSIGYTEGFYHRPRIDKEVLAQHSQGLIGLSGCLAGEIAQPPAQRPGGRGPAGGRRSSPRSSGQDRFYLEVMDHGIEDQRRVNQGLLPAARARPACPLVRHQRRPLPAQGRPPGPRRAALHRLGQEGARTPSACASTRSEFYLKSADGDGARSSRTTRRRCANTVAIAEMCDFTLKGASLAARLRRAARASRSRATSRRSRATASRSARKALEPAGRGRAGCATRSPTTRSGWTRRSASSSAWASPATS